MIRSRSFPWLWRLSLGSVVVVALSVAVLAALGGAWSSPTAPGGRAASRMSGSAPGVPLGARGPIGAALGRAEHGYWLRGLRAANSAQHLRVRFDPSGVNIDSSLGQLRLSLAAYGHQGALGAPRPSSPRVRTNRVTYRRGPLREWYANGPLGLEQGFDLVRAPIGGTGPLTLSFALSGNLTAQMEHGAVLFSGNRVNLRYGGLIATDAHGHPLRSWLGLSGRRLLVQVDDRGARYPLHVDPFIDQAELTAGSGGAEDNLGQSVAVAGDTVAVGAPYHMIGGHLEQGAVYVFVKPASGWATTRAPSAELTVRDGKPNDVLGWSVGMSGDTIVAGAYAHTIGGKPAQGAAYVFVRPAGGWASTSDPTAELTADDGAAVDDLGYSVAISGDTIVAGAPSHKVGTNLLQGAAYVFVKPPGGWTSTNNPSAELTAADGVAADELGQAVGVSRGTVVAGAFTRKVGVNDDQGAVYVFVRPDAGWHGPVASTAELTASDGAAHDTFGISVAVSGDTVVAGAPAHKVGANAYQGAVYVFVRPTAGWSDNALSSELTARDGAAGDLFGGAVAVSGNTVVAGAPTRKIGNNTDQGAVYAFVMPAGGWASTSDANEELTAGAGVAHDELGVSLATAGDTVVGGAKGHTIGLDKGVGAADVFIRPAPAISIESPQAGASYGQGEVVDATFACIDWTDGSGLAGCDGTTANGAPVDTSTPGVHTFTVTATDNGGEQSRRRVAYTVVPRTRGSGGHVTTAPTISRLAQTHRIWRAGSRLATITRKRRIPVGTTFSFTLDQRARVVLVFMERAAGRKVGRRCVAATRTNQWRPACARPVARGTLSRAGRAGGNRVLFQGRVSLTRRLAPGVYTLAMSAVNATGLRSKPRSVSFTIVR